MRDTRAQGSWFGSSHVDVSLRDAIRVSERLGYVGDPFFTAASIAARILSGLAMRPGPWSRQESQPSSGSMIVTPSARSWATPRWTAGLDHISVFIAGAMITEPLNAR